jgi:hypothetical protein
VRADELVHFTQQIPHTLVGLVIGVKGASIHAVELVSGCHLSLDRGTVFADGGAASVPYVLLHIHGVRSGAVQAATMVAQILQRHVSAMHTSAPHGTAAGAAAGSGAASPSPAPPPSAAAPVFTPAAAAPMLLHGAPPPPPPPPLCVDAVEEDAALHERAIAHALFGDEDAEEAAAQQQQQQQQQQQEEAEERGACAEARDAVVVAPLPALPATLVRARVRACERWSSQSARASVCGAA